MHFDWVSFVLGIVAGFLLVFWAFRHWLVGVNECLRLLLVPLQNTSIINCGHPPREPKPNEAMTFKGKQVGRG